MELIGRLREAFDERRLEAFLELLDPEVRWVGIPEPGEEIPECRNREEVREVLEAYLSEGKEAQPEILGETGDAIVVDMRLDPPQRGFELHHVYRVAGGRIVRMEDYPDRASALGAAGLSE